MMVDGGDLILIYRFEEYEEWGFNMGYRYQRAI